MRKCPDSYRVSFENLARQRHEEPFTRFPRSQIPVLPRDNFSGRIKFQVISDTFGNDTNAEIVSIPHSRVGRHGEFGIRHV